MRKFPHVFSFYFRESFLSKKSLITSAILFLIVFGIMAFTHFTDDKDKGKDKIAVVTESTTYKVQESDLNKLLPSAKVTVAQKEEFNALRKQVEEGELDGLFRITEKNGIPEVTYMYSGFPSQSTSTLIASYLKEQYTAVMIEKNNVSPEVAKQLQMEIPMKEEAIKDRASSFGIAYIFTLALYIFIATFGNMIAMNIASEKSSRVMEVMLPKVKPLTMMYAKILAVVSTALLQLLISACGFFIPYLLGWVSLDNASLAGLPIDLAKLDAKVISLFLIYFITGYLLYAVMYAAAGAVVSKIEDLQGVSIPIIVLIMGALFISIKSLSDPNSTIVVISSYIPFFTPMVTFSRVIAGEAGALEISITLAILLVTIAILNFVTSRIYVNGVMNYSDKVKFKDLAKFIKRQ
ncbi:sodium export permease [Bacillus pseudomycoides]|uniref:Sodium export permease n=1 Tax=Bacillus pseudomycoides TaxID=64104 RepID=A0AA91V925_9BACI|nr:MULTISPECIES: ABC transporter permease [Bacillus]PEB51632.1 sodium export permease [Bacillus sp. AFS098217]PED80820.1 sodium export permease [Bacillus pseudomycoides]PEU10078.1 sodium export permease [Bacillus sp. AFS014408]PEU17459.1 sodium export permease [Bacillus sp. AFS019443]PFW63576.1 sodium export permease [Bacillus sp. AFS075034]